MKSFLFLATTLYPPGTHTASQNFQHLGEGVSIGTRRAGSTLAILIQNIPSLKRKGTSTLTSKGEPMTDAPGTGSPSQSLNEIAKVKKPKKDKQEKRKTFG